MPEEAPVMRTTLPARFSAKMDFNVQRKNLRVQYAGKKRAREKKVNGGATRLRKV